MRRHSDALAVYYDELATRVIDKLLMHPSEQKPPLVKETA